MIRIRIYIVFALYVCTSIFISCEKIETENFSADVNGPQPDLTNTKWSLIAFEPREGDKIEIDTVNTGPYLISFFSDSTLRSINDCNNHDGSYTTNSELAIIKILTWGGSRASCGWSSTFKEAFNTASQYEIVDGQLFIYYSDVEYMFVGSSGRIYPEGRSSDGRAIFKEGLGSYDGNYLD